MLKGISPLISPELLATLATMGHGDEIVLADSHFPGNTCNDRVIRADGLVIADLLEAILPLFELDAHCDSALTMMAAVEGDTLDPSVKDYKRSKAAFAVVMTGETAKYGNIILKKGVTPVANI